MGVSSATLRDSVDWRLLRRRLEELVRPFDKRYLESDPLGRVLHPNPESG